MTKEVVMKTQWILKRFDLIAPDSRLVRIIALVTLAIGLQAIAMAGPRDLRTNYYVKIQVVNGTSISAPVNAVDDTGGTTSLSFTDATAYGLLDAAGDPTRTPDDVRAIGGTGGGSVRAYVFNDVKLQITPATFGGKRTNGDARTVTTTVVVPEKPANQPSTETDLARRTADQQRKTASLITKIGKNTAGLKFGTGRLMTLDDGPALPTFPNNRYTTWSDPKPKVVLPVNFGSAGQIFMPGVSMNGTLFDPRVGTGSASIIPSNIAAELGVSLMGSQTLSFETQSSLFYDGLINTLPGIPLTLQYGMVTVTLPSTEGPFSMGSIEVLINPQSDQLYLGANGIVPQYYGGWFDNGTSTYNLASIPEPGTLLLLASGFLSLTGFLRKRLFT